ncbi:hypothetical protein BMW23_0053 [Bodo saltans virus]|uniref:Uncharacterized protein n=1 Tax=Bodo saltans virus TaxID=2024608 RepID=A0A2H4UTG9_9VIRU|nr:hypothetical protein QJ851_gp0052 [Bodo saltans virus]ATZ80115.1 hypothetical protein BMW23_0053 [Bodo saltans virus]
MSVDTHSFAAEKERQIKIKYDDKEEYYDTFIEVGRVLGYDASHICNVLNGRKKESYVISNKKIVFLEYVENDIDMEKINEIKKESKRESNRKYYLKKKEKIKETKNYDDVKKIDN